jgi:hypothetical protein
MQSEHECVVKEEACTEENAWGRCYVSSLRPFDNAEGPPLTACVSRISELRARGASGAQQTPIPPSVRPAAQITPSRDV